MCPMYPIRSFCQMQLISFLCISAVFNCRLLLSRRMIYKGVIQSVRDHITDCVSSGPQRSGQRRDSIWLRLTCSAAASTFCVHMLPRVTTSWKHSRQTSIKNSKATGNMHSTDMGKCTAMSRFLILSFVWLVKINYRSTRSHLKTMTRKWWIKHCFII